MRVSTTTIFVMLAALPGTAALAQSLDQQWAYCENGSGSYSHDQSIAGCSGVIQLGQDSAEDLAIA